MGRGQGWGRPCYPLLMLVAFKEMLQSKGTLTLSINVRPGASKNSVKRILPDGTVVIAIAAAPEKGKANEALLRFLAEEFSVPKSHIEILSGETGRKKRVKIER